MSTKDAIEVYYRVSTRVFCRKNKKMWRSFIFMHEFGPEVLEETVNEMVNSHGIGDLMVDTSEPANRSKAFVCTQRAHDQGTPVRFRTYEPPTKTDVSSDTLASEDSVYFSPTSQNLSSVIDLCLPAKSDPWNDYRDIRIWEAARATTAAPSYFPPMKIIRGNETRSFIDGAMGCNNPGFELVDEAVALYGKERVVGCFLSLGTGSLGPLTVGEGKGLRGLIDLIKFMKGLATDSQKVHLGLKSQIPSDTYFRFQLPSGAEKIRLHQYKKLDELSRLMDEYIEQESSEIDKVVDILMSNSSSRSFTLGDIGESSFLLPGTSFTIYRVDLD
ncbi:hypothetical protein ABKA04_006496 [Annulohypoxylon sp. FPYF3050]